MYKLPERRGGGGGGVIRAMPQRKHSFFQEVFPYLYQFTNGWKWSRCRFLPIAALYNFPLLLVLECRTRDAPILRRPGSKRVNCWGIEAFRKVGCSLSLRNWSILERLRHLGDLRAHFHLANPPSSNPCRGHPGHLYQTFHTSILLYRPRHHNLPLKRKCNNICPINKMLHLDMLAIHHTSAYHTQPYIYSSTQIKFARPQF